MQNGLGSSSHISYPQLSGLYDFSLIGTKSRWVVEWLAQDGLCLRIESLFSELEGIIEVVDNSLQHFFVKEEEGMCSSIKGVGHFASCSLFVDHIVYYGDNGLGEIVEVKDGREGVKTDSVELVAILNK